jgi:hypothetical protein
MNVNNNCYFVTRELNTVCCVVRIVDIIVDAVVIASYGEIFVMVNELVI